IAHFDCDSFFCSIERVFDPSLKNRPIVVLSNNDACVVSRSKEAKALGINMSAPFYEIKDAFAQKGGVAFSSNFTLYADMSARVMSILTELTDKIEVYSIDEAFLNLGDFPHDKIEEVCVSFRERLLKELGIPVSVGIDLTKTLAKLATDQAKKSPSGVHFTKNSQERMALLKKTPVGDIWGIGGASVLKLNLLRIKNAHDFIQADDSLIKKTLTITGLRTQHELRGIPCIELTPQRDKRHQILVSRTIDHRVYDKEDLSKYLADYVFRASEKLRDEGLLCYHMSIFFSTNYLKETPQYYGRGHVVLDQGEDAPNVLIKKALQILDASFKYGYEYRRCGVLLSDLRPKNERQLSLFEGNPEENEKITKAIDQINKKFGPHTIKILSCNQKKKNAMQTRLSKNYTTSWDELLIIKI
ncbi:MAG: Y-family DNA polymerase, partial [Bacteriovorax sp.]